MKLDSVMTFFKAERRASRLTICGVVLISFLAGILVANLPDIIRSLKPTVVPPLDIGREEYRREGARLEEERREEARLRMEREAERILEISPAAGPPEVAPGAGPRSSVYDFLRGRGFEEPNYGLYSYALFPVPSLRANYFLEELFKSTGEASESVINPRHLNLIYLPVKSHELLYFLKLPGRGSPSTVELFAERIYDYDVAHGLLDQICAAPAETVRELCATDLSRGPYLFSYAHPASTLIPIPPPYLFVDLSDVHKRAFGEFISAYKAQVKRTDITDLERVRTFRLRLVSIILSAADWMDPMRKAVVDIVHIVKD